MATQHTSYN